MGHLQRKLDWIVAGSCLAYSLCGHVPTRLLMLLEVKKPRKWLWDALELADCAPVDCELSTDAHHISISVQPGCFIPSQRC